MIWNFCFCMCTSDAQCVQVIPVYKWSFSVCTSDPPAVQNAFMSPNEANDSYDTATMISFHRWLSQSHISFLWIRHVCQWFCCHSTGMQQWSAVFAVSGAQASLATSVPKTLAFAAFGCGSIDIPAIPARPRIVFMAFPPLYIGSLTAIFRALTCISSYIKI